MQFWLFNWQSKQENGTLRGLTQLESHILSAQKAIRTNKLEKASGILSKVNTKAHLWFTCSAPSPRLTALYVASSCLLANTYWRRYEYAKAFAVLENNRQTLNSRIEEASTPLHRQRYYKHCLTALRHALDEAIHLNSPSVGV